MAPEIIFVTGANTGIGYETVRSLLTSPTSYHILLGSRSVDKGNAAVETLRQDHPSATDVIEVIQIDVTDDDSISKAIESIEKTHGRIDALVNNAGVSLDKSIGTSGRELREELNKTYDVNVSGTHVVTYSAIPLLFKSSNPRLLFITSGTASFEYATKHWTPAQPFPPGWPKPPMATVIGYKASKVALNMLMMHWAWVLKEDGVKIWCISPGFLATNLSIGNPDLLRKMGAGEPSLGGTFIRDVVEGKRDEDVGKVINSSGIQAW